MIRVTVALHVHASQLPASQQHFTRCYEFVQTLVLSRLHVSTRSRIIGMKAEMQVSTKNRMIGVQSCTYRMSQGHPHQYSATRINMAQRLTSKQRYKHRKDTEKSNYVAATREQLDSQNALNVLVTHVLPGRLRHISSHHTSSSLCTHTSACHIRSCQHSQHMSLPSADLSLFANSHLQDTRINHPDGPVSIIIIINIILPVSIVIIITTTTFLA